MSGGGTRPPEEHGRPLSSPDAAAGQREEGLGRNALAGDLLSGNAPTGWFPYPPSKPVRLIPPIVLAYVGDAVYEVAVRQYLVSLPNLRPNHLHRSSTGLVSAKAQSRILAYLEPGLTEEEREVVRQGRNAKSGTVPKNADVLEYRHATAFETLIGHLYYSGRTDRIQELVHKGIEHMDKRP
ncbi:Mini-ribonuclease 3 [Paenibacillus sp. CN-4]|uniref:Mini-ribonuclease 3 n=1 Tax=Paenibacillus nanchangensis TaxID=3348343 RepID=UPI0039795E9F